jgi:hypothetical protein
VWQLINKFRETGSVADVLRFGTLTVLTEDKVLDISGHVMKSPKESLRKLPQQVAIPHSSTRKVLK